ncbi:MAG: hypothetical protein ABRQ26_03770 [Syntrophomonadaceae bacterium]
MQSSWGNLIVYGSLGVFIVSALLLALIRGSKIWKHRCEQQRFQYATLYRPLIERIMEKAGTGEIPAHHSYHPSHRPLIYSLMLDYARTHEGDYYAAFDYMGFTDDLLAGNVSHDLMENMEHMAIIRSPMFQDYLYIMLLEEDPAVACQAANALTRLPLTSRDQEIILPSLLNIAALAEYLPDYLTCMKPSPQLCQELLKEELSHPSREVLLDYLTWAGISSEKLTRS